MNPEEEQFLRGHRSHDPEHLRRRWERLAPRARLTVGTVAETGGHPVLALSNTGPGATESGLYLSAGIHGDEPAGALALVEWAERNAALLAARPVVIFPCLNPWGLAHNSRVDHAGRDLNRCFHRGRLSPIREWLRFVQGRRFEAVVMLHEDFEARGIYLYELTAPGQPSGERLLAEVEAIIPRDRGRVDGRPLRKGVVRRRMPLEDIVREIDGVPEAIHLAQHHTGNSLTFETPSEHSLYRRVQAHMAFLDAVVERWPGG